MNEGVVVDAVDSESDELDSFDLLNTVLVSLRQGMFFGVEARIPYAITSIIRPILFNKPSRPLAQQIKFFAEQTLEHGWVIARISVLFKLAERFLSRLNGKKSPEEWHTFVAGAFAGYIVMAHDRSYARLKKQINMAIGIRTIYALGAYCVRNKMVPLIDNSPEGYAKGTNLYVVLMWGVVMWHWRHQTSVAPGEMNVAQVKQMNFIYNDGNIGTSWFESTHVLWLLAIVAYQKLTK